MIKDMIIVRVIGGLGNQMFQYALYKKLQVIGKKVKLDISGFNNYKLHNGYELERIFNIKPSIATEAEINKLNDNKTNFIYKIKRKVVGRKKTHYCEENFKFDKEIYINDNMYLDGYWQTEKYFEDIRDEILVDFSYQFEGDKKNETILQDIKKTNSVSIHIRRGDYVKDKEVFKIYGGITTSEYYQLAINAICKRVENPRFFIFSNDIEWVKSNLRINNSCFIEHNSGLDSYKDLFLMSMCKHNIIANSSFSWWGAWLNQNENKTVIVPDKWVNTYDTPDIAPKQWIKITTDNETKV